MKKKKSKRSPKLGRLNLVIDPGLKDWAHEYADACHTTITALITAHLNKLRSSEDKLDVEQI